MPDFPAFPGFPDCAKRWGAGDSSNATQAAEISDDGVEPFGVSTRDDHVCTCGEQLLCNFLSNALRRAGYQCVLADNPKVHKKVSHSKVTVKQR
jgi:hypothetical protein